MANRRRAGAGRADRRLRAGGSTGHEPRRGALGAREQRVGGADRRRGWRRQRADGGPRAPGAAAPRRWLRAFLVYAPLYTAVEKGYFRERGLELNLEPGGGSPTAQVGAGQLQLAGIGLDVAYLNSR